ncbi:MAG: tRNA 2-thiocytidine biosynthesis protein TtcA [Gammaproteobacteria bacterium]|nr:tRNA 2-thiocytidine biosynthesis protein TtcA [Gammaproteobacteria bacterium]
MSHPAAKPPRSLLRQAGRAIADFSMIRPGDRLLLGLSGGKDSLSLLQILVHLKHHAPVDFELQVATVDPQIEGFDPTPLKGYVSGLGLDYHYASEAIAERAKEHMGRDSFCAFCSRMRRGILYRVAREQGCNVLVLAQHLDDLAESFVMSAFYAGDLRTMKAHYIIDAGDLRVIRPLVYVRERQTADFAKTAGLPVIADNCPACFSMPTKRQHTKELLAKQECENKNLFPSLLHAMRPLMGEAPKNSITPAPDTLEGVGT